MVGRDHGAPRPHRCMKSSRTVPTRGGGGGGHAWAEWWLGWDAILSWTKKMGQRVFLVGSRGRSCATYVPPPPPQNLKKEMK